MEIVSVNVGREQAIARAKKTGTTGIYKQPTEGPVHIGRYGLAGDAIVDKQNHGGVDQAVYVYSRDDYDWWAAELGHPVAPGTFGENLTVAGWLSAESLIGDRLHAGSVVLEVTAPRIPCSTLAARMGDPAFVKRFRLAERPGVYCRVIQEGKVVVGDTVTLERYAGTTISAREMFRSFYDDRADEASIRRHLAAPIAVRARADQEERLHKLVR